MPEEDYEADDDEPINTVADAVERFLKEIPIGQAPIDLEVERLAREGKLGSDGLGKLRYHQEKVRGRVIFAWDLASVSDSKERKILVREHAKRRRVYQGRLKKLEAALADFQRELQPLLAESRRKDFNALRSPVSMICDQTDPECIHDLRYSLRAAQVAVRRASMHLALLDRKSETRGRPSPHFSHVL